MKHFLSSIGSLMLLALPAAQSFAATNTSPFIDVPRDHENARAIEQLANMEIMAGNPDGTFAPDRPLNRAELMKVLIHAKRENWLPETSCFPDVRAEDWYARYVCAAVQKGWVSGYPDGLFRPAQEVTFAEAMKMIVMSQELPAASVGITGEWPGFDAGAWYAPYMTAAVESGVFPWEALQDARPGDLVPRRLAASYIYGALLANQRVAMAEGITDCTNHSPVSMRVESDGITGVVSQRMIGILQDGSECTYMKELNPYARVHADAPLLRLFPISPAEPDLDNGTAEEVPVGIGGTVYLRGGHVTSYWTDDIWVFRGSSLLEQVARIPNMLWISPDAHYVVYANDEHSELHVYDLWKKRSALIDRVASPLIFASSKSEFANGTYGKPFVNMANSPSITYYVYTVADVGEYGNYPEKEWRMKDLSTLFSKP